MTILSLSNIGVSFGATELFKNVTFTVAEGERWGIIGRNGAGKTSIFKLITGDLKPTVGSVARKPGLRHALLDQHRAFEGATTVWEEGAAAWRDVIALEKRIAEQAIELGELGERVTDEFLERFGQTQERFADLGGYIYHARVDAVLQGLGFDAEESKTRLVSTLSGGERGRVGLAAPNTGAMPGDNETAAWAAVQQMPLQSAPGARFSYNQTNYLLLGKIIHSLTAKSFADFIAERQFRVVGMPHTAAAGFGDSHDVIAHGARGYTFFRIEGQGLRTTDTLGNVFEQFPPSLRTAAGMSSTAEEMAKWIIALQRGRLLASPASLATLWTPARLNDGKIASFGGLTNGYALVVLTNLQGSQPERMLDQIASFFVPDIKNVVAKTP